uniref:Uncharacterized protein n=1 Tax=Glossina pallidipes TaxID=7398 RepID=A0A1B0A8D8_GLOPL
MIKQINLTFVNKINLRDICINFFGYDPYIMTFIKTCLESKVGDAGSSTEYLFKTFILYCCYIKRLSPKYQQQTNMNDRVYETGASVLIATHNSLSYLHELFSAVDMRKSDSRIKLNMSLLYFFLQSAFVAYLKRFQTSFNI